MAAVRAKIMAGALLSLSLCSFGQAVLAKTETEESKPKAVDGAARTLTEADVLRSESLDLLMEHMMKTWRLPAGQISVGIKGKVLYNRSYGKSDKEQKSPTTTANLFRIASVSKVLTAAAIHKLIDEGKLSYEDHAFSILDNLTPPKVGDTASNKAVDPRLKDVTIGQLLTHSAGWTIEHGDPQRIYARMAADACGEPRPASPTAIVRYMMNKPMDYTPGSKSVYSNFGFNILGRVIEKVSGKPYDVYVKEAILKPLGIETMELGRTQLKNARLNEVYYHAGGDPFGVWSLFDQDGEVTDFAYGGDAAIESMDSHGGWIACAQDLVKFGMALDGQGQVKILQPETLKKFLTPSQYSAGRGSTRRAGGVVVDAGKKPHYRWTHAGALAGTSSVLYSLNDGKVVAMIFNHLPANLGGFFQDLETRLLKEMNTKKWRENALPE
ncbi:MAG: beta-lactamase family protein [Candidatus Obscuribacter sp.]|nr:beta-lactamase family protein [Candidatus Obscuribacter sp.]